MVSKKAGDCNKKVISIFLEQEYFHIHGTETSIQETPETDETGIIHTAKDTIQTSEIVAHGFQMVASSAVNFAPTNPMPGPDLIEDFIDHLMWVISQPCTVDPDLLCLTPPASSDLNPIQLPELPYHAPGDWPGNSPGHQPGPARIVGTLKKSDISNDQLLDKRIVGTLKYPQKHQRTSSEPVKRIVGTLKAPTASNVTSPTGLRVNTLKQSPDTSIENHELQQPNTEDEDDARQESL